MANASDWLRPYLKTLESVTHFKDTYKLNIRRLFKEYLTPGVPEDKIICLDKVLDGKFSGQQIFCRHSKSVTNIIFGAGSKVDDLDWPSTDRVISGPSIFRTVHFQDRPFSGPSTFRTVHFELNFYI